MGRHGKNQTASAVYGYHEKKKDTNTSGYGSLSVRLGKDSQRDFDCCHLSLHPCVNPVVTPEGYLYEKEAILENLLHQKRENARKMKEYEKKLAKEEKELKELADAETRSKLETFINNESLTSSIEDIKESKAASVKLQDDKKLPSFWIPSLTPSDNKEPKLEKPVNKTFCPMSKTPLRVKDLITVKFTPLEPEQDSKTLIVKKARYKCPITGDVLSNSTPCAVLKPSGDVVTMECVEKLIYTNNMVCPITGIKLKDSDIIKLSKGASGYSGTGLTLQATRKGAAMMS